MTEYQFHCLPTFHHITENQDLEAPVWMNCPMLLMITLLFHLILLIVTANFSNLSFTELCTVGMLYLLTFVKVAHSSNLNWKSKTSYGINYCRITL